MPLPVSTVTASLVMSPGCVIGVPPLAILALTATSGKPEIFNWGIIAIESSRVTSNGRSATLPLNAANGIGGHIIGDGGCVYPGDVAKAFGAGAHFVMLGGMLAGHKEGGAYNEESGTVEFYGMSSNAAMARHGARKDGYRGAEGKVVSLPYKGEVKDTVIEILGGVGSAATYIGAQRIKDMPKCTTFVRCTQQVNTVYGNV